VSGTKLTDPDTLLALRRVLNLAEEAADDATPGLVDDVKQLRDDIARLRELDDGTVLYAHIDGGVRFFAATRCPWRTTVSNIRCDGEEGHDGPHHSQVVEMADYSHGIWWKP
jgi:hypothetical protein